MLETVVYTILVLSAFTCWGSFLNSVAYRLMFDNLPFLQKRSACPQCHAVLTWYDLIPVLSWLLLKRRCRNCKKLISPLYPLIELITLFSLWGIWQWQAQFFISYSIFFSALVVTTRNDIETMCIHRACTLCLLPIAFALSSVQLLPISLLSSCMGALLGYAILWGIRYVYWGFTGMIGIGQGDLELLAMIGAFLGPVGCWLSLLLGSALGTLGALCALSSTHYANLRRIPFPFGAALALGAILSTIFQTKLTHYLF